jgi:recombination protein RecA
VETFRARIARKLEFSSDQWSLILGSLLGDAYLVKTTRGYAFRVNHGIKQKDYVDWKYEIIKDFVNSPPQFADHCYYFRTVSHDAFSFLRLLFYPKGIKVIPKEFVASEINPLLLAVWIMDDGSKEGNQLRINSQSFTKEENIYLAEILRAKLGIEATINRDKNRFRLRIAKSSMQKLIDLISPYMVPSMLYKLSP